MVVLKRLEDAERDRDRIYAVIRGVGSSSDGRVGSIFAPSVEGQARALRAALREAEVDPATIGLVEAHATGTQSGDMVEVEALQQVYGVAPPRSIALGSVKSQIGHTKAAAGAASLVKTASRSTQRCCRPPFASTRRIRLWRQTARLSVNPSFGPGCRAAMAPTQGGGERWFRGHELPSDPGGAP